MSEVVQVCSRLSVREEKGSRELMWRRGSSVRAEYPKTHPSQLSTNPDEIGTRTVRDFHREVTDRGNRAVSSIDGRG